MCYLDGISRVLRLGKPVSMLQMCQIMEVEVHEQVWQLTDDGVCFYITDVSNNGG